MSDDIGTSAVTPDEDLREGVRAEIAAVIETAGKVAHEGLTPGADGPRVLGGLILQLAEQVARLADAQQLESRAAADRSPNEVEAPLEEDRSPQDAPADPSRRV
jgi:hypothetical protein